MSTHTATESAASRARAEHAVWRLRLLASLGPLAALAGVVWAIVQPYRVTLLHPRGQGFWWLFVEPPLLVVLAGALFHLFVARALIEDLLEE
jgi:ABC-type amino acid transport system permease subunit